MPAGVMSFQKFDKRKQGIYLNKLREGMTKGGAAKAVAVSSLLIREYGKQNSDFKLLETEAIEEGSESQIDKVEASLYLKSLEGNVTACMFYLMNRRPHKWRDMRGMMIRSIEDVIAFLPPALGKAIREYLTRDVSESGEGIQTQREIQEKTKLQ